jgi:RNA recognition motif-containing protein
MKRATIVQQDGVSRGFGFVKFALEEDANTALKALQSRELHGRKMKLEIAVQRGQSTKGVKDDEEEVEVTKEDPKFEEVVVKSTTPATTTTTTAPSVTTTENPLHGSNSHLQLIVAGVPSHINKKIFKDAVLKGISFKCKKLIIELLKPEHAQYAQFCAETIIPTGRVMLLTVPSRQDLSLLVSFLDNLTIKALGLVAPVLDSEGSTGPTTNEGKRKLMCRAVKDVTPLDTRKQKCRLILRNLSFQATEENVATRLMKFGPLVEVTIPRLEVEHDDTGGGNQFTKIRHNKKQLQDSAQKTTQLKPRGFAFVMFLCEKDATNAVGGSEGLKICNREFALDFCQHKYGYGFANEEEEKTADDDDNTDGDKEKDGSGSDDDEDDDNSNDEKEDDDDSEDDKEEDDDNNSVSSDYSGEVMQVDDDSDAESEPGSEMEWNGSDSDSDDDDDEDQKKDTKKDSSAVKKPESNDVGEKKTVFVRDLPFDADQSDVKKVFRQFGQVEFALIVLGTLV